MAAPIFKIRETENAIVVAFEIPGGVTTPKEFAEAANALPSLAGTKGVITDGRGPVWGHAMLTHLAHPTPWVANNDPRLGAVVVATHTPGVSVGDIVLFPEENAE